MQRFMKRVPSFRNSAGILRVVLAVIAPNCVRRGIAYSANSFTFSMAADVCVYVMVGWIQAGRVVGFQVSWMGRRRDLSVAAAKLPDGGRQSGLAEKANRGGRPPSTLVSTLAAGALASQSTSLTLTPILARADTARIRRSSSRFRAAKSDIFESNRLLSFDAPDQRLQSGSSPRRTHSA